MPSVPSTSPATGRTIHDDDYIHTTSCHFVDNCGRTLLLRGVNLSGSSKAPVDQPSYILDDFWESGERGDLSFIGRPLNIDDGTADVHLARLRGWGFNMLRFPVTWEALEHEGPGKYDEEFMDYIVRVLRKCKDYGFRVFMDPHQDIWSRFSGGSGAPYWTLAACGVNPRNFTANQSAIVHCEYPLAHEPDPASLPAMIWSTNYGRLASQTLFTLFFAGRDFAPLCEIDGQNIQDYLQSHFIEALGRLADRIAAAGDLLDSCVIGWDSLNEPFEGLCGWPNLNENPTQQGSTLKKGTYPTPAQSLRLGMGQPQTVDHWSFGAFGPSRDGSVTIDPKGLTMWADPETEPDGVHPKWGWKRDKRWKLGTCIWALHGVWDIETGYVMRPEYFRFLPGTTDPPSEVEFVDDYWRAHWLAYAERIRSAHPEAIVFVQPPVFALPPRLDDNEVRGRCVYSPHYYDGLTLITRHWNWFNADALGLLRGRYKSKLQAVKIGEGAIRKSLQEQLNIYLEDARLLLGGQEPTAMTGTTGPGSGPYPTLIGEIGTPFDMDAKRSYGWTDGGKHKGDYSRQEHALDASLNACDGPNSLNYTVWTYCPDGSHDWGDGWNMEDLSLWCPDDLANAEQLASAGDPDARSMFGVSDGSQAGLLRRKSDAALSGRGSPPTIPPLPFTGPSTAVNSSLSLDTLALSGHVMPPGLQDAMSIRSGPGQGIPPLAAAGWCDGRNEYDFLTDGARAVRAFCRPSPHKVIGIPQNTSFDIAKASYKLVVRVTPEDKVERQRNRRTRSGSKSGVSSAHAEGKQVEELATEIFVPLVHFASARVLRSSHLHRKNAGLAPLAPDDSDSSSETGSVSEISTSKHRHTHSDTYPPLPNLPDAHDDRRTHLTTSSSSTLAALANTPRTLLDLHGTSSLLDIDVTVSSGRWELDGQMLKWWYAVPAAGEQPREEWIEVRRRGGAIKVSSSSGVCGEGSWLAGLCPPTEAGGCTIM
ncbi:hypothetical protein HGRIS_013841 [Hohenbuehelia grisea]|uniref:Glycoside hydrolase family 5 protein n=1 Tax=Hohenbuehelia grisea TaxID=104357 RepID=A0ABR3IWV3_9AGAR